MHRRTFLAASATVAMGLTLGSTAFAEVKGRQFYELRTYHFGSPAKQQEFAAFLHDAAVPAYNRAGVNPVGAFEMLPQDNPSLTIDHVPPIWLLLPHDSLQSVIETEHRLSSDSAYQEAGKAVLLAPKADPAFLRFDSMLLQAMEGFPRVAIPKNTPGRIFELRTYESPNQERAANKLTMFNAGEFSVFERAGMPGVFFGGALVGENLPQLTYMIVHENPADSKKHWSDFQGDPAWKKLKGEAIYKDNVSKIIDRFVRPLAASQI